ncbi:MAG: hypothetical protein Q4Q53_08780 [Methanocorpusculum sp.]|nr:hypothetical protein [Methanocorpusculum sp.]
MKYILPIIFAVVIILSAGCIHQIAQTEPEVYYNWIENSENYSVLAHYGDGIANEHPLVNKWINNRRSDINSEISEWSNKSGFVTTYYYGLDLYLTVKIYGRLNDEDNDSSIKVANLSDKKTEIIPSILIRYNLPDFTLPPQKIQPTETEKEKMDALYEIISKKAEEDGINNFPMKFITPNY